MVRLTLDTGAAVTVSAHPDRRAADRALLRYVVAADVYLHRTQHGPARTSYELLVFPPAHDQHHRPRTVGHATIAHATTAHEDPGPPTP